MERENRGASIAAHPKAKPHLDHAHALPHALDHLQSVLRSRHVDRDAQVGSFADHRLEDASGGRVGVQRSTLLVRLGGGWVDGHGSGDETVV